MPNVGIFGGRDYTELDLVDVYVNVVPKDTRFVSGGARGVDARAVKRARERGLPDPIEHVPDWNKYDKKGKVVLDKNGKPVTDRSAGVRRNALIEADSERGTGFWMGVKEKSGTWDSIQRFQKAGKNVIVVMSRTSDIFASDAELLVNPVNCQGVSGKGLAKAFAAKFDTQQAKYEAMCANGKLKPGQVAVAGADVGRPIAYFATKDRWANPSQLDWIASGLSSLAKLEGVKSMAVPALGCGEGGLDFAGVLWLIDHYLGAVPGLTVYVYPPRS